MIVMTHVARVLSFLVVGGLTFGEGPALTAQQATPQPTPPL
jgi:hypothetical protein